MCCWFSWFLKKTAQNWIPCFQGILWLTLQGPAAGSACWQVPSAVPSLTMAVWALLPLVQVFHDYWAVLQRNVLPWRIKVWLVSSNMSQPSTMVLSMARFLRMFSVSLTSSCITLLGTKQNALYLPKMCLTPAVSVKARCMPFTTHYRTDRPTQCLITPKQVSFLFPHLFKSFLLSF